MVVNQTCFIKYHLPPFKDYAEEKDGVIVPDLKKLCPDLKH
jgi:hypothetical protein